MAALKLASFPDIKETPLSARDFSPYTNNGGTTVACAGKDFCVIGGDTRMSEGYSIHSRNQTKLCKLTDKCVLASSGMQADILTLQKNLQAMLQIYEHDHGKSMSTPAIAQFLSNQLYYKRFFPYYSFNVLGGIDENGVGCCWSYDAVGSHERSRYSSSGTGQQLVQPLLDNQVGHTNQTTPQPELTVDAAKEVVMEALTSAGERDIHTGDFAEIMVIDKNGVHLEKLELKFD